MPEDYGQQKTFVKDIKSKLKSDFPPKYTHGCKLMYRGKVLKSRHHLHHYGVQENDLIEMNDTKDWSSSSTSSSSTN